jgi:hypothetical protein
MGPTPAGDLDCFVAKLHCNQPPSADAGPNVWIESWQQTSTVVAGNATDPDGDSLSYRWLKGASELLGWTPVGPNGNCPLQPGTLAGFAVGVHELTLEVKDGEAMVSDTMVLTVANSPPTVVCAGDINVSVWSSVELNATVADADGDMLTCTWQGSQGLIRQDTVKAPTGGAPMALPALILPDGFPIGTYSFTLTVSDGISPAVTEQFVVIVTDSGKPNIAPVASPAILWPPNHQMVDVFIAAHATDNSGDEVTLTVDQITSTEQPDTDGDGYTIPDWAVVGIDQKTGIIRLQLRAERSGKGPGRTYTIAITATDGSGNAATVDVQVQAPHDKGK